MELTKIFFGRFNWSRRFPGAVLTKGVDEGVPDALGRVTVS
jgi:hypothetical protein